MHTIMSSSLQGH